SLYSTLFRSWTYPRLCSPLFPYTTLFRSRGALRPLSDRHQCQAPTGLTALAGRVGCSRWPGARRPCWRLLSLLAKSVLLTAGSRSEEHTSELQSRFDLVCRLLPEKTKT